MRSFADGPPTTERSTRRKPFTNSIATSGSGSGNGWKRSIASGQKRSDDGSCHINLGRKEAEMNLLLRIQRENGFGAIERHKPSSSTIDRRSRDIGPIPIWKR